MKVNTEKKPPLSEPLSFDIIKEKEGVYAPVSSPSIRLVVLKYGCITSVLTYSRAHNILEPATTAWAHHEFQRLNNATVKFSISE